MARKPLYPHVPKGKGGSTQIDFQRMLNYLNDARSGVENAEKMLDVLIPREPRVKGVEDLFSGIYDRIQHLKEDIEDIAQGRPFRHVKGGENG